MIAWGRNGRDRNICHGVKDEITSMSILLANQSMSQVTMELPLRYVSYLVLTMHCARHR
jgi:hypothetical protein